MGAYSRRQNQLRKTQRFPRNFAATSTITTATSTTTTTTTNIPKPLALHSCPPPQAVLHERRVSADVTTYPHFHIMLLQNISQKPHDTIPTTSPTAVTPHRHFQADENVSGINGGRQNRRRLIPTPTFCSTMCDVFLGDFLAGEQ